MKAPTDHWLPCPAGPLRLADPDRLKAALQTRYRALFGPQVPRCEHCQLAHERPDIHPDGHNHCRGVEVVRAPGAPSYEPAVVKTACGCACRATVMNAPGSPSREAELDRRLAQLVRAWIAAEGHGPQVLPVGRWWDVVMTVGGETGNTLLRILDQRQAGGCGPVIVPAPTKQCPPAPHWIRPLVGAHLVDPHVLHNALLHRQPDQAKADAAHAVDSMVSVDFIIVRAHSMPPGPRWPCQTLFQVERHLLPS